MRVVRRSRDRLLDPTAPNRQNLRTIASCSMMRPMSDFGRTTMTSDTIFVISITGTTKITVPAGPGGRD